MALDPRRAALGAIAAVIGEGRTLDEVLPGHAAFDDPRDAALARALCFGVLRWFSLLQARLRGYLRKPFKPRDQELEWLMMLGIYQLGWMRQPPHAAIHATVEVARALGKPWATGLINGVLRNFQRAGAPTRAPEGAPAHIVHAHPEWLVGRIRRAWPDDWRALLEANNHPGPMWLRVNTAKIDRSAYLEQLTAAGIAASGGEHAGEAVRLEQAVDVSRLPGFAEGLVSVQDGAAQLAAGCLMPAQGDRVLDACAAPGGKTAHLLEAVPGIEMTALDRDPARLQRLADNLSRLGLSARSQTADAAEVDGWWDGRPFDAILLDAPCSASGVIRRHPDIKWLRRDSDIDDLAGLQARLLEALWPTLRPGGRLLYATCSVLPEENDAVIEGFLDGRADARCGHWQTEPAWGRATRFGRQILPGEGGMDGFFYALLEKP